ncbi:glycosyltransferase family 4 protein [Nakamurella sp.]|uniref:glycosyltransferase family 4 protein n=1 Tax=Nakamurella sp. TaxID=1869182 RepID=UPI003B3B6276
MAVESVPLTPPLAPAPTPAPTGARGPAVTAGAGPDGPPLTIVLVEFLPTGGMFQFTFLFGEALARQGHRVLLLTGPGPELRSATPGLEVVSLFPTWDPNVDLGGSFLRRKLRRVGRALRLVESWRRATGLLRRLQPDLAQFGELRYPLDSALFLRLAKRCPGVALVDVAHNPLPYDVNGGSDSVEKGGRLTRRLLDRAYRACDLVLVLGDGPRATLESAFPGLTRVAVCGHGDYSAVLAGDQTPPPSAAPPNILFFGSWTTYKNLPLLLDAFALVRATRPEIRLTLAGPVMPDVDPAAIGRRAAEIGNVDLRPGYVPMEDVPGLFAAHRVVIFTYSTVNISGSVHMAYTFGRPVVATDVGSMSDAVIDGETGLLTAPDPAAVAAALIRVLDDPAAADRMGAQAVQRVHDAASWSAVVDKAVPAYRDAVQATRT